jgi:hypothetical protein
MNFSTVYVMFLLSLFIIQDGYGINVNSNNLQFEEPTLDTIRYNRQKRQGVATSYRILLKNIEKIFGGRRSRSPRDDVSFNFRDFSSPFIREIME